MSAVNEPPEIDIDDSMETAYIGRFDPLEVPIILEVLRENGIFAFTKTSLEDSRSNVYPTLDDDRGAVMVDRARVADAKRLIDEEVPKLIDELRSNLEDQNDPPPQATDLAPFGWLEAEVARELLVQLADAGIGARPEYPLDRPAPPYARADGRVRVHVEELFLDEAAEMLENEVREELVRRGVALTEPILGTDES